MEWTTYIVSHTTDAQVSDPIFHQKAKETFDRFKRYRSEVIEAALFVENSLTNVLQDFLGGGDLERRTLLRSLIFDAEFCSFFQKWRMLRQLLEEYGFTLPLTSEELKSLREELHDIISLRNKFAHGTIYVDARDFSVLIEFFEGKKILELIDEKRLKDKKELCDRVHGKLWRIHEALDKRAMALQVLKT